MDVHVRAEGVDHGLQRDGERQDDDRRDHGDEALGDAFHRFLEGQDLARDEVDDRQHERDQTAPGQADERVGVAEGTDEIARAVRAAPGVDAEEAADIDHADRAGDDQHEDRQDQIDHAAVGVRLFAIFAGQRGQIALGSPVFKLAHGAVVELHGDEREDEDEGQDGIKVVGDGLDEQLDAAHAGIEVRRRGGDRRRPGRDRRDHAHGRGRGVDEVGQLRAGDLVVVGDRAHDGADGQAVEIVVDENEHTEHERGQLRADARFDVRLGPAAEGGGAARRVDQRDDDAQQHEEQEDARVAGDGGDEAVIDNGVERRHGREAAGEQTAHQHADEQRAVRFLGDERENDRNDRRQQRPGRVGQRRAVRAFDGGHDQRRRKGEQDDDRQNGFPGVLFHGCHSQIKCVMIPS